MQAIIMAAGQGIRLGKYGKMTPKCLLQIHGTTILEHQLHILHHIGITNIKIVIGTSGSCWNQNSYNRIRALHPDIILNFDNATTYNTYSSFLALEEMDEVDTLCIDGDMYMSPCALSELQSMKHSTLLVKRAVSPADPGTKVITQGNTIVDIGSHILTSTFPWYIHSGVFTILKRDLKKYKEIVGSESMKTKDFGESMKLFINHSSVKIHETIHSWANINTREELALVEKDPPTKNVDPL